MTTGSVARVSLYAMLGAAWVAAAWLLAGSVVPDDLSLPRVDVDAVFGKALVDRAERYERFLYVDWALAQVALLATLAVYARRGVRYMRESAAGPIGTGMFLGMVGLAIVWLVQLPFSVAALWWDRRHGVSEVGYLESRLRRMARPRRDLRRGVRRAPRRDGARAPARARGGGSPARACSP